jgi:hypothetical protein
LPEMKPILAKALLQVEERMKSLDIHRGPCDIPTLSLLFTSTQIVPLLQKAVGKLGKRFVGFHLRFLSTRRRRSPERCRSDADR